MPRLSRTAAFALLLSLAACGAAVAPPSAVTLRPPPAPAAAEPLRVDDGPQVSGGYTVTPEVASPLVAGVDLLLISTVTRDGAPVTDLQNDEGATGSVLLLREGALDPIHAHPADRSGDHSGHGGMLALEANQVAFGVSIPEPGRYRVITQLHPGGTRITVENVYDVVAAPHDMSTHGMGDMPDHEMLEVQVVPVQAFQWGYEPSTIRVVLGTPVQLSLTSRDVPHSLSISGYDVSQTILPGQTRTLVFVADRAGTFPFGCDVACGTGHPQMRGTLIVE